MVSHALLKCNKTYFLLKIRLYPCCNELCSRKSSPTLPVDLLEKVDIKVDGAVEDGEEVAEAGGVLHPGRPVG